MKRATLIVGLCVIFVFLIDVRGVFACDFKQIEFCMGEKIFTYCLSENIKSNNQFDLNYAINKYNRFGSAEQQKNLLKDMLNAGFNKDVAINYLFPNFNNLVLKMQKNINRDCKNASMVIDENSSEVFKITKEIDGIKIDVQQLYNIITQKILNDEELKINLPIIKIKPQKAYDDFKSCAYLRADFSTDIAGSSADRKHNIKNAINSLNKVEVMPNQVFSFNSVVGKRTPENGYRNAKIIINNEFVDGVGGGVCQVSSTLYNSALLAGLEIVEANKHSKQVSYVDFGFDAMVNFGSSDLKFRNNTGKKITIITNFSNSRIRIRIFGEDMCGVKYKLKNEVFNVVKPCEEIKIDTSGEFVDKVKFNNEFFYLKKGNMGMEIKSYREKYVNNKLEDVQFLRHDKFKVQNTIKVYGALLKVEDGDKKKTEDIRLFKAFRLKV